MEHVAERITNSTYETGFDPLSNITDVLLLISTENNTITWMAQPIEQAIYVHADSGEQFDFLKTKLTAAMNTLNVTLHKAGKVGHYYCNPDHDRHCIDLYYSRF